MYTASWSKETALVFVATEVVLNRQEATPGHWQSYCSLPQDETSCLVSPFLCSTNSSLAFLSLLSGLSKMNSEEGMSDLISCNHLSLQNFLFLLPGISEQLSVMTQHHIFGENLEAVPLPLAGRGEQAQQKAPPAGANPVWNTYTVCCKSMSEWESPDIHWKRSALASNFRCKLHTTTDALKKD